MFKKIMIASAILAVSSSVAFATGAPYLGASLGQKTNTSTFANFRGVTGNVFVGYGATIGEGVYLGAEVFVNVATASISDNGLKSTTGFGASFIPGLLISDHTMGFVRVGVVRTSFSPSGLSKTSVTAGQLGVGLQTNLMQNWDLRGEYDYDAYNSLSGLNGKPRSDEFNLGLIYKFD
jgi:opacity protein-like surface antigen